MSNIRLLRITTVPISLKLLLAGQVNFFQQQGFEILTVSADGPEVKELLASGIRHRVVNMTRTITPFRDLIALYQLIRVIRKFKPDIVHSHTPKAGLLGMVASWVCRVPVRMHTVAGLPMMEASGIKKRILRITEKITYELAHQVYPNSKGLLEFIVSEFQVSGSKFQIIGNGSSNGIDVNHFSRTDVLEGEARAIRKQYKISDSAIVFCFIGRVVKDKGIKELIEAFKRLQEIRDDIYLFIVGPLEKELDPLSISDLEFLEIHPKVIMAGFQPDVRPWLLASDIFVFPSYREGFPNVVMQAACMEIPCIVSDINGCNEIIQHHETGIIVPVKNSDALYEAMSTLVNDKRLGILYGKKSREYVVKNFDQQYVWGEMLAVYRAFGI